MKEDFLYINSSVRILQNTYAPVKLFWHNPPGQARGEREMFVINRAWHWTMKWKKGGALKNEVVKVIN